MPYKIVSKSTGSYFGDYASLEAAKVDTQAANKIAKNGLKDWDVCEKGRYSSFTGRRRRRKAELPGDPSAALMGAPVDTVAVQDPNAAEAAGGARADRIADLVQELAQEIKKGDISRADIDSALDSACSMLESLDV